jgi:hypothetical protein
MWRLFAHSFCFCCSVSGRLCSLLSRKRNAASLCSCTSTDIHSNSLLNRLHNLPLTEQQEKKEWANLLHIAKQNGYTHKTVTKLFTRIRKKVWVLLMNDVSRTSAFPSSFQSPPQRQNFTPLTEQRTTNWLWCYLTEHTVTCCFSVSEGWKNTACCILLTAKCVLLTAPVWQPRYLPRIKHACAVWSCRLWPARLYFVFPHYFINSTIFGEKNIERVMCCGFLYNFCRKHFSF